MSDHSGGPVGILTADVLEGWTDGRPPLVLLHGLNFDRTMWHPAMAELYAIDPARQVLAVDLPPRGRSGWWLGGDIDGVAAAVHTTVEWTRLTAPVIVGHAAAALIATVYAATYPVRGVVNVGQRLPTAPGDELAALLEAALAEIRATETGYLFITGQQIEPGYQAWLEQQLPRAVTEVWPGCGQFPHLDCPARFAARLAATAGDALRPARPRRRPEARPLLRIRGGKQASVDGRGQRSAG